MKLSEEPNSMYWDLKRPRFQMPSRSMAGGIDSMAIFAFPVLVAVELLLSTHHSQHNEKPSPSFTFEIQYICKLSNLLLTIGWCLWQGLAVHQKLVLLLLFSNSFGKQLSDHDMVPGICYSLAIPLLSSALCDNLGYGYSYISLEFSYLLCHCPHWFFPGSDNLFSPEEYCLIERSMMM